MIYRQYWKTVILLLLAFALAAPGPARAAEPEKYTLPNGLEVLLIENHRAPVVSILVWIKAGSAAEGPDEYGLAHLIEHMMFKGTDRRGPGMISTEVEAAGGDINAYTSFDQTVYYVNMASRFAERGLDILADMVLHPALDPAEFAREKEVVLEEVRRGEDSPDRQLSEALFGTAYQVHPYGRPVIGFVESIRELTVERARAFHQRWYEPGNMILAAAGDFRSDEFKTLIERYFGGEAAAPVPRHDRPAEPEQKELRVKLLRGDVTVARMGMAFHITEVKSSEIPALDLLGAILGDGRTSRLYSSLKRDKELVNSIYSGTYTPEDPGLLIINADLAPDKIEAAARAAMAEAARLAFEPVTGEELARVKLNAKADFVRSRETMSGEARTAAYFEALLGDYRAKDSYLEDLDKITPADIMRAASKYLRPENLTLAVMVPEKAAPALSEDSLRAAVRHTAAVSREEKVSKFTLSNGATLLVKPDHSLPLAALKAVFHGGLLYETPAQGGLTNYLAEVWDRGTTGMSAEELARAVEDIGGKLGSFSGRNSFGLEGEFLSQSLDRGLELFTDLLTRPAFSREETEKARPNILAAIKRQQDELTARAFNLFSRTLYQGHPYGRDVLGEPAKVEKISAADLKNYYDRYARPADMVISVAGDVDPERVRNSLEKLLSGWTGRPAPAPVVKTAQPPAAPLSVMDSIDRAQAHMVLGFMAPGLENPDRYALEVLDNVLSGMGGRLFLELRDKQSLAYTVTSFYRPGLKTGSFGLYIGFDPSKLEQARRGFRQVLDELAATPISEAELSRAKEYILGVYEVGQQTFGAQAMDLALNELYGLGYDYGERYLQGINAVTAEQVLDAARRYLDRQHSVEVLVGPIK